MMPDNLSVIARLGANEMVSRNNPNEPFRVASDTQEYSWQTSLTQRIRKAAKNDLAFVQSRCA